jgi:hypothetical protein
MLVLAVSSVSPTHEALLAGAVRAAQVAVGILAGAVHVARVVLQHIARVAGDAGAGGIAAGAVVRQAGRIAMKGAAACRKVLARRCLQGDVCKVVFATGVPYQVVTIHTLAAACGWDPMQLSCCAGILHGFARSRGSPITRATCSRRRPPNATLAKETAI